ncbi:MAG: hypothetical protein JW812_02630 [Alphaproteobacteria bacterium]|nr:hypothetical protein [Alphaproteobacteria bacterium]MBN2779447.1 hypothetical protein [Alphaproteobacteria bacterium]
MMKNFTIVDGFKAFPSQTENGGVYLPLSDLVTGFEFPITVNPETGTAEGWFMKESRSFKLNLSDASLVSDRVSFSLTPDDVKWADDDIYIHSSLVDKLFPVRTTVNTADLMLHVEALEPMPFEERVEREKKRKLLREQRFKQASFEDGYLENTDWFSFPFLDFGVSYTQYNRPTEVAETTSYTLSGNQLFLGLDTSFNFYGNSASEDRFARVNLSRYKPNSDILGFAKFIEMGDINTYDVDLISTSTTGRGINLSSFDEKGNGTQRNYKLQGQLTQGWEVEVYRNNVLMDFSTGDGTGLYQFENLPLQMGLNKFKLIFYGPQGQRREEEKEVYLSPTAVKGGELAVRFFAQEDVKPLIALNDQEVTARRAGFLTEYGLSSAISLTGGFISYEPMQDAQNVQEKSQDRAMLGLKTGFSVFRFGLSGALADDMDTPAYEGLFEANFSGLNLYADHSVFNGLKTEKSFLDNEFLYDVSNFSARFRIPIPYIISLPFYSRLKIATSVDGEEYRELTNTLSLSWWKFYLSGELRNKINFQGSEEETATGNMNIQMGAFSLRGEGRYDLKADLLQTTALGLDWRGQALNFQAKWTRNTDNTDRKTDIYSFNASRRFSFGAIGAGFSFDSTDSQTLSISYNASLLHNPLTSEVFLREPGLSHQGAIATQSFLDENYDDAYTEGEPFLKAVSYETNGSKNSAGREDSVSEFIIGLSPHHLTNVKLNPETLGDISYHANEEHLTVMARPGVAAKVKFPVMQLGAIDGEIALVYKRKDRPVKGIRLLVKRGDEVIAETITDNDGYYGFEKLRPGGYTLEFQPEQMRSLGYGSPRPLRFVVDRETVFKTLPTLSVKYLGKHLDGDTPPMPIQKIETVIEEPAPLTEKEKHARKFPLQHPEANRKKNATRNAPRGSKNIKAKRKLWEAQQKRKKEKKRRSLIEETKESYPGRKYKDPVHRVSHEYLPYGDMIEETPKSYPLRPVLKKPLAKSDTVEETQESYPQIQESQESYPN